MDMLAVVKKLRDIADALEGGFADNPRSGQSYASRSAGMGVDEETERFFREVKKHFVKEIRKDPDFQNLNTDEIWDKVRDAIRFENLKIPIRSMPRGIA